MKKTIAQLKKDLVYWFNRWIRLRDCDGDEGGNCISCGKWYEFKRLDAGHFWPSTYSSLKFHEDNVNAQCSFNCNKNRRGNRGEYRINLIKKIGEERVQHLEDHRNDLVKWDRESLIEKIAYYKSKVKEYE